MAVPLSSRSPAPARACHRRRRSRPVARRRGPPRRVVDALGVPAANSPRNQTRAHSNRSSLPTERWGRFRSSAGSSTGSGWRRCSSVICPTATRVPAAAHRAPRAFQLRPMDMGCGSTATSGSNRRSLGRSKVAVRAPRFAPASRSPPHSELRAVAGVQARGLTWISVPGS